MLTVKTYLDKSAIDGLGVFAGQDVKKGDRIWTFVHGFDMALPSTDVDAFPDAAREYIKKYAFQEKGIVIFTGDNDRYTNHSFTPNTYMAESGDIIAKADIRQGEEITSDYREFDEKWREKLNGL